MRTFLTTTKLRRTMDAGAMVKGWLRSKISGIRRIEFSGSRPIAKESTVGNRERTSERMKATPLQSFSDSRLSEGAIAFLHCTLQCDGEEGPARFSKPTRQSICMLARTGSVDASS